MWFDDEDEPAETYREILESERRALQAELRSCEPQKINGYTISAVEEAGANKRIAELRENLAHNAIEIAETKRAR